MTTPQEPDQAWVFQVSEDQDDERLDKYLVQELLGQFSRERIQDLIESGCVLLDSQPCSKVSTRLKLAQKVTLSVPEPQQMNLIPEEIDLKIVYEDADLLVVNKPAGMLTHPAGKQVTGTLVNALLYHCEGKLPGINGVLRPGIVHRLDKETSGLLMVAKTEAAHWGLSAQLKDKSARRDYLAIVQGELQTEAGTVNAAIGRDPKHRDKMRIVPENVPGGRRAVTHWQVREQIQRQFSLVQLSLETGRTHQIRVHLASIGHPVVGDMLYGSGLFQQLGLKSPGQRLQAFQLAFRHPISGKPLQFERPMEPRLVDTWAHLTALY
ncbi:MAG: RluA family pseudouridine synthase [Cyanobacteria bacterium]|nr:RluA family pseudouridine synthase [Cyanobacteriota bacterium]